MFTFDGWVTRVTFELHWALETRLHASALNSELGCEHVRRKMLKGRLSTQVDPVAASSASCRDDSLMI